MNARRQKANAGTGSGQPAPGVAWDVAAYEAFSGARSQPLEDLLSRLLLPADHVGSVLDAGCGTGKMTARLAERFPHAQVLGVDSSERMLMHAPTGARLRFVQADLQSWVPSARFDLVVANAVLQWIPGPEATLRRMARWVAPGGAIALQVPANFDQPSHVLARQAARRHAIEAQAADHVLDLDGYRGVLESEGFGVQVWQETYEHVLSGPDPVLRWLVGTTLRPYIQAAGRHVQAFLADLGRDLAEAYPPGGDGRVVFPFTRRFAVGVKTGP